MKPSKEQKRLKRNRRAYRVSERQWLPGLHTRWVMAGRKAIEPAEWVNGDAYRKTVTPAVVKALVETVQRGKVLADAANKGVLGFAHINDFDEAMSRLADALKGAG